QLQCRWPNESSQPPICSLSLELRSPLTLRLAFRYESDSTPGSSALLQCCLCCYPQMPFSGEGIAMPLRPGAIVSPLVLFAALSTNAQTPIADIDIPSMQMSMPQNPSAPKSMNTRMDSMKPPTNLIDAELNHTNSG